MVIRRVPLRDQVYRALLSRLLSGEMIPGSRLSDSAVAGELGVSRTPVRETLVRLEREGFLESDVGRGFFVKPLSAAEVREVFPVFWTLEGLAVREGCPLPPDTLRRLDEINARAAACTDDPERSTELGVEWHQALRGPCPNEHLLEMLATLGRVARRYAIAFWRDTGRVHTSVAVHAEITDLLRRGETDAAVARLEAAWSAAMQLLARWLESNDRT